MYHKKDENDENKYLFSIDFNSSSIGKATKIKHEIYNHLENNLRFDNFIPTCNKRYLIIIYFERNYMRSVYIVWDIKN